MSDTDENGAVEVQEHNRKLVDSVRDSALYTSEKHFSTVSPIAPSNSNRKIRSLPFDAKKVDLAKLLEANSTPVKKDEFKLKRNLKFDMVGRVKSTLLKNAFEV